MNPDQATFAVELAGWMLPGLADHIKATYVSHGYAYVTAPPLYQGQGRSEVRIADSIELAAYLILGILKTMELE